MMQASDLPRAVPVFPLPGALLLPRARLPLHVFEPRYLQMLEDTLKTPHRLIAMVQPCPTPNDDMRLHKIGCAGRVTQFSETDDGRYFITLSGVSRFRVISEIDGFTPYRRAKVNWDGFERDLGRSERDNDFDRARMMQLLGQFLEARGLSTDWDGLKEADDELLINSLSMLLEFGPEDKQALLEAPTLQTRRETLITLIEFALRSGNDEDTLQ